MADDICYLKSSQLKRDQCHILQETDSGDRAYRFTLDIDHLFGPIKANVGFFYVEEMSVCGYTAAGATVPVQFTVIRKEGRPILVGTGTSAVGTNNGIMKFYGSQYVSPFTSTSYTLLNALRFGRSRSWTTFKELHRLYKADMLKTDFNCCGVKNSGDVLWILKGVTGHSANQANAFAIALREFLWSIRGDRISFLRSASTEMIERLKTTNATVFALNPSVDSCFPPMLTFESSQMLMLTHGMFDAAYEIYKHIYDMSLSLQVPNATSGKNDTYSVVIYPGPFKLAVVTVEHTIRALHSSDTLHGLESACYEDIKSIQQADHMFEHHVPTSLLLDRYICDFAIAHDVKPQQWAEMLAS